MIYLNVYLVSKKKHIMVCLLSIPHILISTPDSLFRRFEISFVTNFFSFFHFFSSFWQFLTSKWLFSGGSGQSSSIFNMISTTRWQTRPSFGMLTIWTNIHRAKHHSHWHLVIISCTWRIPTVSNAQQWILTLEPSWLYFKVLKITVILQISIGS